MLNGFRRLIPALKRDPITDAELSELPRLVRTGLLWMAVAELVTVAVSYPFSWLIDELNAPTQGWFGAGHVGTLIMIAAMAAGLRLLQGLLDGRMSRSQNAFLERFWTILEAAGQRHLLALDHSWHAKQGTGEKESVVTKNHRKLINLVVHLIYTAIPVGFRALYSTIALWVINWRFGLVMTFVITSYLLVLRLNARSLMEMMEEYRAEHKLIEIQASEMTKSWQTLKNLGVTPWAIERHHNLLDTFFCNEIPRHIKWRRVLLRQDYVLSLGLGLALMAAWQSYEAGVSIGGLAVAMAWYERVSANLHRIIEVQNSFSQDGSSLRELTEFFETEPTIVSPDNPRWPDEG